MEVDPDLLRSGRTTSEVKDLTAYGLLIEAMSVCHTVKPIKQTGMLNEGLKYYSVLLMKWLSSLH